MKRRPDSAVERPNSSTLTAQRGTLEFAFVPRPPPSALSTRPTWYFERQLWREGFANVAGADEAGRGCLAGPVVAAAVILEPGEQIRGLRDSKLIEQERRERIAKRIKKRARAWAVGVCSPDEIDKLNILWASLEAMRRAINAMQIEADYVLVDGNQRIPGLACSCRAVVKGDARSRSVAAASILAKTHRDALMRRLHGQHPKYGWDTNVGYPTPEHYEALDIHGPTALHRRSFRLSREDAPEVTPGLFEPV